MSSPRRDTRPAVLDAAWRLLEERGARISLNQVARAAGISRQAVYLHFENRNDLLVAVAEHAKERTGLTRLVHALETAGTPRALFSALARLMAAFHPTTAGASLAVEALCREDRTFGAEWTTRPTGRLSMARRIAERLAAAGVLALPAATHAADLIWAVTGPALYEQLVVRRGWSLRRYEAISAALLMPLVLPASADRPLPLPPRPKGATDDIDRRRSSRSRRSRGRLEPRRRPSLRRRVHGRR